MHVLHSGGMSTSLLAHSSIGRLRKAGAWVVVTLLGGSLLVLLKLAANRVAGYLSAVGAALLRGAIVSIGVESGIKESVGAVVSVGAVRHDGRIVSPLEAVIGFHICKRTC